MRVIVNARHMEVTEALRGYALEKVDKLPHLYDSVQSAEVTFDLDGGQHVVEIVAAGKRKSVFVARHRGKDMYACLDQAVHKLQEQLRRHKDRVRDRQGPRHGQGGAPGRRA